jgi:lipopolysaccharide transport system ATP-binding protein
MKPIIKVENLSKQYKLGGEKKSHSTLRESLTDAARLPLKALQRRKHAGNDNFWALKDVSFEVMPGEIVGVIGRNGAGKSTLLKILSRITEPTTGKIELYGRIGSLLEVGTGFHPELTGRENIFLNGAILGMRQTEIVKKFDEIIDFAGIEEFLDTPVKRYSSGMYTRLAFAVAANLDPEILVVDEVLSVGDAEFQNKCINKMQTISNMGRTVLFVSHNLGSLRSLCKRGLLLQSGKVILDTNISDAINVYSSIKPSIESFQNNSIFKGDLKNIKFSELLINNISMFEKDIILNPGEQIVIEVEFRAERDINFSLGVGIVKEGARICTVHDADPPQKLPAGEYKSTFVLPEHQLRPGVYSISLGGYEGSIHGDYIWAESIVNFKILEEWGENYRRRDEGIINIEYKSQRKSI